MCNIPGASAEMAHLRGLMRFQLRSNTAAGQDDIDDDTEPGKGVSSDPVTYDKRGDLTLHVGPEPALYQVCSRALARVSEIFDKMLYGGYAESEPETGEWTVALPEDDSRAMAILCSIIHGAFRETPETLSLEDLYNLLMLSEKYDTTTSLRPWVHRWIEAVRGETWNPHLLSVARDLGEKEVFGRAMETITENCEFGPDGELVIGIGSSARGVSEMKDDPSVVSIGSIEALEPTDVLETITKNRERLVEAELQPMVTICSRLLRGNCRDTEGPRNKNGMACSTRASAPFKLSFGCLSIDNVFSDPVKQYKGSVSWLRSVLRLIEPTTPHIDCRAIVTQSLAEARKAAAKAREECAFVSESQMAYLKNQAIKMGFPV